MNKEKEEVKTEEKPKGLTVGSLKEIMKDQKDDTEIRILSSSGMEWKLNKKAMAMQMYKIKDKEKSNKFTLYIT